MLTALCRPALQQDAFVAPATAHEIADELVVTEAAVKQHLLRLYQKFRIAEGVNRRARLANEVISAGVVRPLPDRRTADGPAGRLEPGAARSAASTQFLNSIATVVGPTPADARRDGAGLVVAGLVDVGQQLLALVADAAADHGRAGGDVLGLQDAGTPTAAMTTSARRV